MKNKQVSKFIFLLTICIGLIVFFSPVKAQVESIPLTVAPARQIVEADPGEQTGAVVKFFNTGNTPISGTFKVADFIVSANDGSPDFLDGPNALSSRYAAASWVKLSHSKATIAANGKVLLQASINVPKNANPGGKYFAVFFEPDSTIPGATDAAQQGASGISARIAGLIYMKVAGPVMEKANIVRFSAPNFSEFGPIPVTAEVSNQGDYHITPKGQVTLSDMFGRKVAIAPLKELNVFPNSSRVFTTELGPKWLFGKFTASLLATYGDSNKALASSVTFWVMPWRIMLVVLLAIMIIIFASMFIYFRFVKKEKKLEEALEEETRELKELKEKLQDKITDTTPKSESSEENETSN